MGRLRPEDKMKILVACEYSGRVRPELFATDEIKPRWVDGKPRWGNQTDSGQNKLYTQISVMHNVRALEPLKNELPQLYSEINKRASFSEAGHFYLLDSIRGYINA